MIERRRQHSSYGGRVDTGKFRGGSDCLGVDSRTDIDERQYGFRLVGDYGYWKTLVRGNGDVIDMLMAGDFEIDGDIQTILQYSGAAVALTQVSADIDSRFMV